MELLVESPELFDRLLFLVAERIREVLDTLVKLLQDGLASEVDLDVFKLVHFVLEEVVFGRDVGNLGLEPVEVQENVESEEDDGEDQEPEGQEITLGLTEVAAVGAGSVSGVGGVREKNDPVNARLLDQELSLLSRGLGFEARQAAPVDVIDETGQTVRLTKSDCFEGLERLEEVEEPLPRRRLEARVPLATLRLLIELKELLLGGEIGEVDKKGVEVSELLGVLLEELLVLVLSRRP